MFDNIPIQSYEELHQALDALLEEDLNVTANLANASALLDHCLENINWEGFYLFDEDKEQLILGPFQGKPACTTIEVGKGVYGTAYRGNEVLSVEDDNEFTRKNACHKNSKRE